MATVEHLGQLSARSGPQPVPSWATDETDLPQRMLTLTYRVAVSLALSRRERGRLCRRTLAGIRAATPADSGRQARAEVLVVLRSELGQRTEQSQLDAALHDAILLDELTLLPPRQRFALSSAALARATVADIGNRTGWTPAQVARLLRAALRTVTARARA